MESHLLQMRGLKPFSKCQLLCIIRSHLLQMRGLKLQLFFNLNHLSKSHLLQMRGLKLKAQVAESWSRVASFTDAWIETTPTSLMCANWQSHLLQMRGLKQ